MPEAVELDAQMIEKAARLVYLGLESAPGLSTSGEYKELLREYKNNSAFRVAMNAIVSGLELEVLEVDISGIFLRPRSRSIFAMKRSSLDKYVGLILISLAAYYFPNDAAFDEESAHFTSPITVNKLDVFIRDKCRRIKEDQKPLDSLAGKEILELF